MVTAIRELFHQPYFICLLALIASLCFYFIKSGNSRIPKNLIWGVHTGLFIFALVTFLGAAIYRIYHPQDWDFSCFYLYGKTAAAGLNFYTPDNFHHIYGTLDLPPASAGFEGEVLDVGFPYPPPTMLYFMPLGFLSFKAALIAWTSFNLLFVAACIYLIYTMFLKQEKLNGLLFCGTLFLIFLPCISTINFGQTNFILLFYLLMMKKYADKKISGVFLALAMFTKPYMIIFGLFFLIRKNWGAILYCMGSATLLLGIAFLLFGKAPFESYLFDNFVHRLPTWSFTEEVNQSLHSVLVRNELISADASMAYLYIVGAILLATAGYIYYLVKRKLYDYIWAVLLMVALTIYPATLMHYGVLLLFVIFQLLDEKKQLGLTLGKAIPVIVIFYFLSTFSTFAAICFLLTVIVLKSIHAFRPLQAFHLRAK